MIAVIFAFLSIKNIFALLSTEDNICIAVY